MALCYGWFGVLKFLPGQSPAEGLAADTIAQLTFGLIAGRTAVLLLALLEVIIALALIWPKAARSGLVILMAHMAFTFTPLLLMPEACFTHAPWGLTLVGQYIVKNLVIAFAGWALLTSPQAAVVRTTGT